MVSLILVSSITQHDSIAALPISIERSPLPQQDTSSNMSKTAAGAPASLQEQQKALMEKFRDMQSGMSSIITAIDEGKRAAWSCLAVSIRKLGQPHKSVYMQACKS